ncbi:MAG: hypothetical protein PHG05_00570 [Candidatus Nanoarchaeia archaeon]|nr:hypothetical protein [Candidatus Nanoarchaeia archaeon]
MRIEQCFFSHMGGSCTGSGNNIVDYIEPIKIILGLPHLDIYTEGLDAPKEGRFLVTSNINGWYLGISPTDNPISKIISLEDSFEFSKYPFPTFKLELACDEMVQKGYTEYLLKPRAKENSNQSPYQTLRIITMPEIAFFGRIYNSPKEEDELDNWDPQRRAKLISWLKDSGLLR